MNNKENYIEEEISIIEFMERFLGRCNLVPNSNNSDENGNEVIPIENLDIEILGKNLETGEDEYNKINSFIIKSPVEEYYTDGKLKGTNMHRVIENGKEIHLKDHPDFHKEIGNMNVVDFEINKTHNYYANGRLNHNTEPCGKATSFHSSVKVRFETIEKLKDKDKQIVGTYTRATVRKNRLGPPFRQAEFEVYFDSGIADYASWIETAKKKGIVTGPSNGLVYNGEKFNTETFVNKLNSDAAFKDGLYTKICESVIMQYKTPNSKILENLEKETEVTESVIEAD